MILAVLAPSDEDPKLRPARRPLPLYPPSDLRGRWSRTDQGYRGGSPEIARLLAWIDAVAAHEDPAQVLAALETAELREEARAEGYFTEAARWLSQEADPELRAAFTRPDVLEIILGYWDVDNLSWHPGMADLTAREAEVVTLSLYDLKSWEIRDALERYRGKKGLPLAVKTIDNLLSSARGKLAALFHRG